MTVSDPFTLQRFVDAQSGDYDRALGELRAGRKTSHWIWYVFPQLKGLGESPFSQFYGISGLEEARAYLAHPLLGPRLRACVEAMLAGDARTADAVLGAVDARKFRSCLTLFGRAAPDDPLFAAALARFFGGAADQNTLDRLKEP